MAIEVRKKDNESAGSLMRRFTRSIQQSGVLIRARRIRFKEAPKTKREIRESALYRQGKKKEEAKLIKLGKFVEEPKRFGRR